MTTSMHKQAVNFAIKHRITLGRDHHGNYYVRANGAIVETTRSANPTAANAVAMMKRFLRN